MEQHEDTLLKNDAYTQGLFQPRADGLPLLFVMESIGNVLLLGSLMTYVGMCYGSYMRGWRQRSTVKLPRWLVDLWVLGVFGAESLLLWLYQDTGAWKALAWFSGLAVLADNGASLSRDFVLAPRLHQGRILYTDPRRWIALTAINVFQIVLAFSLAVLSVGDQFKPAILDATTAIYYSAVTFVTLGYGDYLPNDDVARRLVLLELTFVLAIILTKLPVAVSIVKTAQQTSNPQMEPTRH